MGSPEPDKVPDAKKEELEILDGRMGLSENWMGHWETGKPVMEQDVQMHQVFTGSFSAK